MARGIWIASLVHLTKRVYSVGDTIEPLYIQGPNPFEPVLLRAITRQLISEYKI
jgi:hypothetical protein